MGQNYSYTTDPTFGHQIRTFQPYFLMAIIPDYNITGQQVTPQEILDVIPEQEASDRAIQASEERYLQQLEKIMLIV